MTEIAGKRALITGGASGIGRLMALEFARRGAGVVVWDLDEDRLGDVVEELKNTGVDAHGYVCDVANKKTVAKVAKHTRSEAGAVDILINNAGVVSGASLLDLTDKKIETTFGVNVLALFWVTRAFLGEMVERDSGHVVTISSAGGLIGVPKLSDYSASKFAAFGFDEALRNELREAAPGVRTTIVCPYYIDTGMFEGVKTRFSALLPILQEDRVARKIVDAIAQDRSRLFMPPMVYLVPALRLLPIPALDFLAGFFGINKSMEEFKGRVKKAAVRLVPNPRSAQ